VYNAIEDYAIIGDTHSTALISRNGSIDWLCWPRRDSPALFLRLIDDDIGGFSDIELPGGRVTARRYVPGTNILETSFECPTGRALLRDFMPMSPNGLDGGNESSLIRAMVCLEGRIAGQFRTRPSFDFARAPFEVEVRKHLTTFTAGQELLRVRSDTEHGFTPQPASTAATSRRRSPIWR
jgi:GH15 family glucan-1,4-alpha-glucosidase